MGKALYVGVDSKARKGKKAYIGVDGKARKVKKIFVGDANGKARLCWSSANPLFVLTSSTGALVSEDLNTWESITFPTQLGGYPKHIVYGNGTYVVVRQRVYSSTTTTVPFYVAYSIDGRSWTVKILENIGVYQSGAVTSQISFCNGMFVLVCGGNNGTSFSPIYYTYTSSDGKTWTKINTTTTSTVMLTSGTDHVVYGLYGSQYKYLTTSTVNGSKVCYSYSSDLITWTQMNENGYKPATSIYDLFVTADGSIYMICEYYYVYQILSTGIRQKITYSTSSDTTTGIAGYCHNPDADETEIAIVIASNPLLFKKYVSNSLKKSWSVPAGGRLGTHTSSVIYGGGKYVVICAGSSSSDKVYCCYSEDGGTTWTQVMLGTVSAIGGVTRGNDAICFGSGE